LLPLTDMLQMERSGDTTLRVTLEWPYVMNIEWYDKYG
jgi:hypothetical protein